MEEEDYTLVPLDERLSHKVWKARQSAYLEYCKLFETSRNSSDECFTVFNQSDALKKAITDSNVVAQESALLLALAYFQYGATPKTIDRLKNTGIVSAFCEKGLSSSRAGTKSKAAECLLMLVEISDSPNLVVEEILPFLKHRLPKLVAGCVNALYQIIENYGCATIDPSAIIEQLPKLFAHSDRNVRSETTKLTVEIYKWMKDALRKVLFDDLKPVQQKDLAKAFELVDSEVPVQKRLTRLQQQQAESQSDADVEMADAAPVAAPVDPFELMKPVDVLSKIPDNLQSRINDPVWKERKAVLEEVHEVLGKAPKLSAKDDFTDLIRIFAKCMKDANIQVVQLAANCVEFIAVGLRKSFHKYYSIILVPMLERTKEKKPSVADALNSALDAIFNSTSLSDVLDGTLATMAHKTPQIKISCTNYLLRCLRDSVVPPSAREIDDIMAVATKLLTESQEPIRQAGTEAIGTLMKITGERELRQFLDKVDDNRKAKIFKVFEAAQVKSTASTAGASSGVRASNPTPVPVSQSKPVRKPVQPTSTLPSKRLATSPAKRTDIPKLSSYGRGLTGRPLASNTSVPKLSPATPRTVDAMETDPEDLNELRALREEKKRWVELELSQRQTIEKIQNENLVLKEKVNQTLGTLDQAERISQSANVQLKQKDLEISKLVNEVESLKLKVKDLENSIDMMKLLQKPAIQQSESYPGFIPGYRGTDESHRITSGELSSRVDRLSIDGDGQRDNSEDTRKHPFNSGFSFDDRDKDWTSAADITNQLKERIKKMKARTSIASNHV